MVKAKDNSSLDLGGGTQSGEKMNVFLEAGSAANVGGVDGKRNRSRVLGLLREHLDGW